ncbi:MAG: tetratricopeptide repeat protein [Pseudomonadales bacterium]
MKRTLALLLALTWINAAEAAETVTPALAKRVINIIERAEEDRPGALADLKSLADGRRAGSLDLAFVMHERAALLMQDEQLDTARRELEATLSGQPPSYAPRLRYLLAQILLLQNEPGAALRELESWAAQFDEPSPSGLLLLGYTYIQLDRFEDAARMLEQALASAPRQRAQWVELLAYAYTRTGRPAEAITLLEGIIADRPGETRWWRQLATIYLLMENLPRGTAGIAITDRIEPLDYDDARRLARLFAHLNMPADGARVLADAMAARDQPVDFDDRMLLGELWMLAREFDQSVAAFRAAATIAEDGESALMLAQLYVQREEYELARKALRESLAAYAEEAPARVHYLLAIVEINLSNWDAASLAVEQLRDDPQYAARSQRLERYIRSGAGQ